MSRRFQARHVPDPDPDGPWARLEQFGRLTDTRVEVARRTTLAITSAAWERVDVSGQFIDNYTASASAFDKCDFGHCTWGGGVLSDLPQSVYRDCDFSESDLRRVSPRFARFERCFFKSVDVTDWNATCAEFVDCTFAGRLLGAKFSGRPWGAAREKILRIRNRNEFHGNDFRDAELIDCSILGGIDLDSNQWPQSPDYVIVRSAQNRIAAAKAKPEAAAPGVAAALTVFSMGAFAYQQDLFVRRQELGPAANLLLDD